MRPLVFVLSGVLLAGLYFHMTGSHFPAENVGGNRTSSRGDSLGGLGKRSSRFSIAARSYSFGREKRQEAPRRRVNRYPIPKRIDMGHIEGKGIGYEKGYSKLSLILAPEYEIGHSVSMLDLRAVAFDDGKLAANVGIITRFLPQSYCEVFGLNVFYDFREGKYGNFNQVSGGFEVLHRRWEVHGNARIPVGRTRHKKACTFDNYIGPYREVCKLKQFAEYAFDVDVGYYLVRGENFQLYAGAGPYYLTGHSSAVGGRAVLRPQFTDYFSIELSASYDHIYHAICQANVVLTIPLYNYSSAMKHKKGPCGVTNRQIYQPIDRDVVLLNAKRCCHHNW